ncbi:MAG: protein kinase, partial [Pirellulaceae bacterium]|nr:protein kinase [Pirellulaceae bacterium]
PNIVPIHDIAVTGDDTLFYAMKRVVGTPWSKVIHEKSQTENVDILLKVCDAIAFAHTRGVVHRDIKPENIMLGDFGVVLVMDWGLALATPEFEKIDSIVHTAGLGGTPAFMAPEMATGPMSRIGPASDVYLLGATLYLIITGQAPHQAENITQCIKAVAANIIRPVDKDHQGELLNIAMKAMATEPANRYPDVQSFQEAIREFRSHSESIALVTIAQHDYERGVSEQNYNDFSRSTYGYEQAITLWPGNQAAREGLAKTTLAHAEAAYQNEDYDLGLSLLDDGDQEHQPLIEKLHAGLRERESRHSRLILFKRIAAAMLAFILVGGSIALYFINDQRNQAITAKQYAEEQTTLANEKTEEVEQEKQNVLAQKAIADKKTIEAEENLEIANAERIEADKQRREADRQREAANKSAAEAIANGEQAVKNAEIAQKNADEADRQRVIADQQAGLARKEQQNAEYEVYLSRIGLAKAKIERNEFDGARDDLRKMRTRRGADHLGWEWRWLWRQANQSNSAKRAAASLTDLSLSQDGKRGAVVLDDGSVELLTIDTDGNIASQQNKTIDALGHITAVGFAPDGQSIAIGSASGAVQLWDARLTQQQKQYSGHQQKITDLHLSADGQLISTSIDRTARVWDVSTAKSLAVCWHIGPVQKAVSATRQGRLILATVVADATSGRGVVWELEPQRVAQNPKRIGEFQRHKQPISCIALSPDGTLAASGDIAGNVFLWRPMSVRATDYKSSIADAISDINGKTGTSAAKTSSPTQIARLIDRSIVPQPSQLVSTSSSQASLSRAHFDVVEAIQFDRSGERILTVADDYTLKLWDVDSRRLHKTLRGHGGWVTDARFVAGNGNHILSISKDASIRSWDVDKYVDDAALTKTAKSSAPGDPPATRETRPHADEIWSARFDPTGQRIISASRDHTARILKIDHDTMTFREVAQLRPTPGEEVADRLAEGTDFQAMSVAVDRVNGHIFVGSADSTVRIWDLVLGTQIGRINGTGLNSSLALSRDGRILLTGSSSPDVKAIVWAIDPSGQAKPRKLYSLRGHQEAVTAIAIAPNGRILFTGDRTGIGWFWNVQTGQRFGKIIDDARGYRINAAQFSPDGRHLYFAADDQQLTRIDVDTQKRSQRFPHDGLVTQLSTSADGKYAVTVSEQTTKDRFVASAHLWDLASTRGRVIDRVESTNQESGQTERAERSRIMSAEFGGQSNRLIVSRSADDSMPGRLKIWSMTDFNATPARPRVVDLPTRIGGAQMAIPLTDEHMLTLNRDAAFLWNMRTMTHERSYRAHAALTQASFSFDGRYVATGSRSVKIWDSDTGLAVGKLESPHRGPVRSVEFARKGPAYQLATGGDDGWVRVWDWDPRTRQFKNIKSFSLSVATSTRADDQPRKSPVRCVSFSSDGQRLLAAGDDSIAHIWSLTTDSPPSQYHVADAGSFTCGVFSADGQWIALGGEDKKVRLWRVVAAGKEAGPPIVFIGHADQIEDVAILQDGSQEMRVFTASLDKTLRVWDPRVGSDIQLARELITLQGHARGVTAVDATGNGELILSAGRDGKVILWPATKYEPDDNLFDELP